MQWKRGGVEGSGRLRLPFQVNRAGNVCSGRVTVLVRSAQAWLPACSAACTSLTQEQTCPEKTGLLHHPKAGIGADGGAKRGSRMYRRSPSPSYAQSNGLDLQMCSICRLFHPQSMVHAGFVIGWCDSTAYGMLHDAGTFESKPSSTIIHWDFIQGAHVLSLHVRRFLPTSNPTMRSSHLGPPLWLCYGPTSSYAPWWNQ